jgi:hypothetical protein
VLARPVQEPVVPRACMQLHVDERPHAGRASLVMCRNGCMEGDEAGDGVVEDRVLHVLGGDDHMLGNIRWNPDLTRPYVLGHHLEHAFSVRKQTIELEVGVNCSGCWAARGGGWPTGRQIPPPRRRPGSTAWAAAREKIRAVKSRRCVGFFLADKKPTNRQQKPAVHFGFL